MIVTFDYNEWQFVKKWHNLTYKLNFLFQRFSTFHKKMVMILENKVLKKLELLTNKFDKECAP